MMEQMHFSNPSKVSSIMPMSIPPIVLRDGTADTLGWWLEPPNNVPGNYSLVCCDQLDTTSKEEKSIHKQSCVSIWHGHFKEALGKWNHITPLALGHMIQTTTDMMDPNEFADCINDVRLLGFCLFITINNHKTYTTPYSHVSYYNSSANFHFYIQQIFFQWAHEWKQAIRDWNKYQSDDHDISSDESVDESSSYTTDEETEPHDYDG